MLLLCSTSIWHWFLVGSGSRPGSECREPTNYLCRARRMLDLFFKHHHRILHAIVLEVVGGGGYGHKWHIWAHFSSCHLGSAPPPTPQTTNKAQATANTIAAVVSCMNRMPIAFHVFLHFLCKMEVIIVYFATKRIYENEYLFGMEMRFKLSNKTVPYFEGTEAKAGL